jgi:hypothetical protein
MKQVILKYSGKKFIAATFLSASVLLTSLTGDAAINYNNIELISGEKTNIAVTSTTSDALVFKVNVNNEKGDKFLLTIKNNAGDVLFSKFFDDVNFQKQFKLLKGDNDERYYFTITSDNKNLEDTYVVSTTTRVVNDVAINKL